MNALARGIIVAAPRSGAGKTAVTLGLQRTFARRGIAVAGAKCGPDYIDPAFHAAATGGQSINLDGFAMPAEMIRGLACEVAKGADLIIAEGAMGLFDGARTSGRSGAAADIAHLTGWPVLLVVDADAAAQSVAAVAYGCSSFPGAPPIAGVIVNRIASDRHAAMVADGFARIDLPLLGMIRRNPALELPSRHLGLVQAGETAAIDHCIDRIAEQIAAECDLDAIHGSASPTAVAGSVPPALRPPGRRIAVARDAAFAFFYPHIERWWRSAGADLRFFSPLADEAPPEECDACWLPGGYPELQAGRIADNMCFLEGLRRFATNRPVHGECGGYMVLGRSIEDADGVRHPMADLLPIDTSFARRRMTLGYRRARLREATGFAEADGSLLGHEFHYATIVRGTDEGVPLADMADAEGSPLPPAGHRAGLVTGSFFHLIA